MEKSAKNVTNYLFNNDSMYIVQNPTMFNFSLDSILLPNFITLNKSVKEILDIGSGNAPIPLILSTKTSAKICGVEIQNDVYQLGLESIKLNNLENQITFLNQDIKEYEKNCPTEKYDLITCNPPYFKVDEGSNFNESVYKQIARHEIYLNLDDIFRISKKLLKNNAIVGIVHRPDRLVEILETMKKYNIEPKKIQFVYPKINAEANILLVEGRKNGKSGLKILEPLYVHDAKGNYTKEILKYFE